MDLKRLKTLHLLEIIAEEKGASQRYFSDTLSISLGRVNAFIKRLVKKGHCEVTSLPSNRSKYRLTPSGSMEKTRLTYEYIISSYGYYKSAKNRLRNFFASLEKEGASGILFFGAGELGDIARRTMEDTPLKLIDVVDPSMEGKRFAHLEVKTTSRLKIIDYDVVLITVAKDYEGAIKTLHAAGVPRDKIRFLN